MKKAPVSGQWIRTYPSRTRFYPLDAKLDDIYIEDIAHSLSLVCRYGGHVPDSYSVAQHSCMVSDHLPEFKLEGLLHDGTEAYLGDIVRPVKHSPTMRLYRLAENKLDVLIHEKFELDPGARKLVKVYDNRALQTELLLLFQEEREEIVGVEPLPIKRIPFWSAKRAEREFLKRWDKLKKR